MEEQYDSQSAKCSQCEYFIPNPECQTPIDPDIIWPEGCELYGFSLSDRWPLAENCHGFKRKKQLQNENYHEEIEKFLK